MNIIQKLFRRGTTVNATTEADDVLQQLEDAEALKRRERAEQIVREKAAAAEYTAKLAARREKYLREVETELAAIWRVLPALRWHLLGLKLLEGRTDELGRGTWESVTGLPYGLADRLSTEITRALADTALGAECYVPGTEASTPIVTAPGAPSVRFVAPVLGPPPGYTGAWIRGVGPVELP